MQVDRRSRGSLVQTGAGLGQTKLEGRLPRWRWERTMQEQVGHAKQEVHGYAGALSCCSERAGYEAMGAGQLCWCKTGAGWSGLLYDDGGREGHDNWASSCCMFVCMQTSCEKKEAKWACYMQERKRALGLARGLAGHGWPSLLVGLSGLVQWAWIWGRIWPKINKKGQVGLE